MMLLLCATTLALIVLMLTGIDSPAHPAEPQATSIPAAIR
jgi:hypothetical protein